MKILGIFSRREEQVGYRLSGMDTKLVKDKNELEEVLTKLKWVIILVIDNNVYNLLPEKFDKLEKKKIPLLLKVD